MRITLEDLAREDWQRAAEQRNKKLRGKVKKGHG